jgi:hypothetical protein
MKTTDGADEHGQKPEIPNKKTVFSARSAEKLFNLCKPTFSLTNRTGLRTDTGKRLKTGAALLERY